MRKNPPTTRVTASQKTNRGENEAIFFHPENTPRFVRRKATSNSNQPNEPRGKQPTKRSESQLANIRYPQKATTRKPYEND
jgi:hypothetical protein